MRPRLELLARTLPSGALQLCSPTVGLLLGAVDPGRVLTPGAPAGALLQLDTVLPLVVPAGASGRVLGPAADRERRPLGYGDPVYELQPLEAAAAEPAHPLAAPEAELAVRAPHSGRFWHRPAPDAEPFVRVGATLVAGQAIGLIEVMKTFSHVRYEPGGGLPERARVVRILADDGAEVSVGDPLVEIEAA